MNLKLYGASGQKKLAEYPDRIRRAQKLQDAIPKIQELNLAETGNLRDRLRRYLKDLCAYEVSMRAVISCYKRIIQEAKEDCDKLEEITMNAPGNVSYERKRSLTKSIVQTKQQVLFVEQHCNMLDDQITNVEEAKAALKLAISQNTLANLVQLCAKVKDSDTEIRNSPK